jgi:uncharacterized membrane protein (DUF485 family)
VSLGAGGLPFGAVLDQLPAEQSRYPVTVLTVPAMSTQTTNSQPHSESYLEVERSPDFAVLRRALRRFVFPMTVAFFLWYALYVILSAYARGFMGTKVVGNINVALVFGLLQFVSTFLIAWLYARYADRKLDPLADRLRERVEGGTGQ